MTVKHHPSESSLFGYASGKLTEAASLVVAVHLSVCPDCRNAIVLAEELGGAMIDALPETSLSPTAFEAVSKQLDAPAPQHEPLRTRSAIGTPDWLPEPLKHYNIGNWRWLVPGVRRVRIIPRRRGGLDLMRVEPGMSVGTHGHHAAEFTCVLYGGFSDCLGQFGPGDFIETDPAIEHRPVADLDGACICIMASDRRIKLRGVARLVQPFLGV